MERKQRYILGWEDHILSLPVWKIESTIYIFAMSPLMTQIAAKADFIETDITYDHMMEYKYISLQCSSLQPPNHGMDGYI